MPLPNGITYDLSIRMLRHHSKQCGLKQHGTKAEIWSRIQAYYGVLPPPTPVELNPGVLPRKMPQPLNRLTEENLRRLQQKIEGMDSQPEEESESDSDFEVDPEVEIKKELPQKSAKPATNFKAVA